jgi:hypothetical protein
MSSAESEPFFTYEPELRENMGAVSSLSFRDVDPGDKIFVEIGYTNTQPQDPITTFYTIDVEEVINDNMHCSWVEWSPTAAEDSVLVTEGVHNDPEDILDALEEEIDGGSKSTYEYSGVIAGCFIATRSLLGKGYRALEAEGYIRASSPNTQSRLLFKEAMDTRTLDYDDQTFFSSPVRNIYLLKISKLVH